MHKTTLMDLVDLDVITEGEIRLLLDITKDQWKDRKVLKALTNHDRFLDGMEFYQEAYQRRFCENVESFFIVAEEELKVPLLNFIDIKSFSVKAIGILDNQPKRRRKNINKSNKRLRTTFPDNPNMQKHSYWFNNI